MNKVTVIVIMVVIVRPFSTNPFCPQCIFEVRVPSLFIMLQHFIDDPYKRGFR